MPYGARGLGGKRPAMRQSVLARGARELEPEWPLGVLVLDSPAGSGGWGDVRHRSQGWPQTPAGLFGLKCRPGYEVASSAGRAVGGAEVTPQPSGSGGLKRRPGSVASDAGRAEWPQSPARLGGLKRRPGWSGQGRTP
ncbi:hypothetical protein MTP06_40630 [Streptomyces sp. PLM4]|nr:hypothetical protein MTP06_40630 [Streptomyces sp. PLM4]